VQRLHSAWKSRFGLKGHKFKRYNDPEAQTLLEALEQHGEAVCMLVLKHAPNDGMVSGRTDEHGQKHESIGYIFGNQQAFARILREAEKSERANTTGNPAEIINRLREVQAV
jgi:hypothetical protein